MADAYKLEKRYLRHMYRELLEDYLLPYYDLKGTPEYTQYKKEWREARQTWRDTEWNDRSGRDDRDRRKIAEEWFYGDEEEAANNNARDLQIYKHMRPFKT